VKTALFASLVFVGSFFAMVFLMTLYLHQQMGLSALRAGLTFVPLTVLAFFTNIATGCLPARFRTRPPLSLGLAVMAFGLSGLALDVASVPRPSWWR
jgi:DHA2 family methylenomycin A resistance protein-like MFS transporter